MNYLPMRTEATHYVDYSDLEDFIKAKFGFDYEIVAAEETSNDTCLDFDITGEVEDFEDDEFDEMKAGAWKPFRTRMLLNRLANINEIPKGNYIIKISW